MFNNQRKTLAKEYHELYRIITQKQEKQTPK